MSFVSWRAAVNRAVGAELVLPITGLISSRLSPNNLLRGARNRRVDQGVGQQTRRGAQA